MSKNKKKQSKRFSGYVNNSYDSSKRGTSNNLWNEEENLQLLERIRDPNLTKEEQLVHIKQLAHNIYALVVTTNTYYRNVYLKHLYDQLNEEEIREDILYLTDLLLRKILAKQYDLSKGTLYTYISYIVKAQSYLLAVEDIRKRKKRIDQHIIDFSDIIATYESFMHDDESPDNIISNYLYHSGVYVPSYAKYIDQYKYKLQRYYRLYLVGIEEIKSNISNIILELDVSIPIGQQVYIMRSSHVLKLIASVYAYAVYTEFNQLTHYEMEGYADETMIDLFGEDTLQLFNDNADIYEYIFKSDDEIKSEAYKDIKNRVRILVNRTRALYSHENRFEFNDKLYEYVWQLYSNLVKQEIEKD